MIASKISITTRLHSELVEITDRIRGAVDQSKVKDGMCYVVTPHTTAGITVNENADPSVGRDILKAMDKLIPWDAIFEHEEGNSPAHIKASLVGPDKAFIIENGVLQLGQWQGIFLCEFDGPRQRDIFVKVIEG